MNKNLFTLNHPPPLCTHYYTFCFFIFFTFILNGTQLRSVTVMQILGEPIVHTFYPLQVLLARYPSFFVHLHFLLKLKTKVPYCGNSLFFFLNLPGQVGNMLGSLGNGDSSKNTCFNAFSAVILFAGSYVKNLN